MFHKFTDLKKNCITYLYIRKAIKMFVDLRLSDITAHLTGTFQETLHIKKGHFWNFFSGGFLKFCGERETEVRREHFLAAFGMMDH